MDFDASKLLEDLFGGTALTKAATVAPPVVVFAPTLQPVAAELSTPAIDALAAGGDDAPDFDSLPLPGDPCPVCGSLEQWTDAIGRNRCEVCERAILDKAIRWADRAARLREKSQLSKPAPRIAPGCVATGRGDILDLAGNRPTQGLSEALAGCKAGQGTLTKRGEWRQVTECT